MEHQAAEVVWCCTEAIAVYGDDLEQFCAMVESGIMALEWHRLCRVMQQELAYFSDRAQ